MKHYVETASSPTLVTYALAYARTQGWAVLPLHTCINNRCSCGNSDCSSPGKHPRTRKGVHDATTDAETIKDWWAKWPNANIGIATGRISKLFVIDVDTAKGATLEGLEEVLGTRTVRTGSGGYHFYLRSGEELGNTTGKLGPSIDTRGNGGYVVAPPSCNQYGPYTWTNKGAILPLPESLLAKLRSHSPRASLMETIPETPPLASEHAPEGKRVAPDARNSRMTKLAGTLLQRGFTRNQARFLVLAFNERYYGQGGHPQGALSNEELERTVFKSLEKWETGQADDHSFFKYVKELKTLMNQELPPVTWIIEEILPEGLTILAGKPKMGKSWLLLSTALNVTGGSLALGKFELTPMPVLYLSLEDSEIRLRERVEKLLAGRSIPDGFRYSVKWRPLKEGGLADLDEFMELYPDTRLIVIDTLACVRTPGGSNGNLYQEDYALMRTLHQFAHDHHIAVILVHHTRKQVSGDPFDDVSGTTGLTGAADTTMILQRERQTHNAILHITGRDVEEQELALIFQREACQWVLSGQANERKTSHSRQEILDLLQKQGGLTPLEIAEQLKKPRGSIRTMLSTMLKDQLVVNLDSRYSIAPSDDTSIA